MGKYETKFLLPSDIMHYERTQDNTVQYFSELGMKSARMLNEVLDTAQQASTFSPTTPFRITETFLAAWGQGWRNNGLELLVTYAPDKQICAISVLTCQQMLLCNDAILSVDLLWGRTEPDQERLRNALIEFTEEYATFIDQIRWPTETYLEVRK